MADERSLPHDIPAEQCVLGGMLLSTNALADVTDILGPNDFYNTRHGELYGILTDRFARGEPTDPRALITALPTKTLGHIGGGAYLHTLLSAVPTTANTTWYARKVADHARLRRLIQAGTRIVQTAYQAADDATDYPAVRDQATQALYEATVDPATTDAPAIGTILTATLDEIEQAASGTTTTGISTGLPDLDDVVGGLGPGQFIVIAGRPGMGKSVLGMDLARHCTLRQHRPAYVANLEMSRTELMKRILAAETGIAFSAIHRGRLNDEDWSRITRAGAHIAEAPLHIDDNPDQTIMSIRAKARRLAQRDPLALVVVDYIQLLTPGRRVESRQQEVAEVSRGLKLLAKELAVPVVAIAQLNRQNEQRAGKRPLLSDLRESGALEQDSDLVMLLHRDDYYDRESARAGEIDIDVAKNRNGPTDTVTAVAQLHLMRLASFIAA